MPAHRACPRGALATLLIATVGMPSVILGQRSADATAAPRFGTLAGAVPASVFATTPPVVSGALDVARPPLTEPRRSTRIALQFLASSVGAAGGGLGAFLVLRDVGEQRVKGDESYTRAGNVGYLAGSFAGATIGAHVVGTRMGGRSALWATAAGALVGTAPLIALGVDEPYLPLFGFVLGWIPQAALATIGFRLGEPDMR